MNAVALILAAGAASRMQLDGAYKSKALLPVPSHAANHATGSVADSGRNGHTSAPWLPALASLAQAYRQAGVQEIILVSGYHHEETEALGRDLGLHCVRNNQPEQGMFSSVCAGLATISACEAFFVHPVDIPLVRAKTIKMLLDAARNHRSSIILPEHAGEEGHPPLIPFKYRDTILAHDGHNGLAGALAGLERTHVVVPDDPFVLEDMDTPSDYDRLCRKVIPALCLVRHGALAPNPEHRFVGSSDIALADTGRRQMARLASELEEFLCDPSLAAIVSSDLQRSRESARILLHHAQQLGRNDLVLHADPAFNEIRLGRWEGLAPAQVMAQFPGQYEARGRDVAHFCPPEGESFAQVQRRALAGLAQWQHRYPGCSLLLVGHAGVNRCLLAHFLAQSLSSFTTVGAFLALPQTYAAHCFLPLPPP